MLIKLRTRRGTEVIAVSSQGRDSTVIVIAGVEAHLPKIVIEVPVGAEVHESIEDGHQALKLAVSI